ncbi:TetR/AcrR family transcriptional regulator [Azospirillum rugosum]|uniref:AcrR family transcriptional regulator n=1 Tax=Azospirillum rugosum TaxID=416170 RepID=A0ABS4SLK9_9PROT|nr:TetR/AcrR family transcriptional regulator [Azospirillum rugosum]MBP2293441.1 AcrR family transcriptional regulator [Azospirillum rugosum]MDQ0530212.1 AcrR family transcriptional regulator [Azospirillum rugosum]
MVRPRKDERIDIKTRAVESAARLFVERGTDAVTMQDIAAEVGCRAPALYRYFPNKEALLLAVHDDGFRRLYAHKAAAGRTAGDDAYERLRLGGLAYVRFALENPNLYELMFIERGPFLRLNALRAAGNAEAEDIGQRSLEFLKTSILACQKSGYLEGLDPDAAAFTFWSVVHGAVSLALRRRGPFHAVEPERIVAQAVETMMALVARTSR